MPTLLGQFSDLTYAELRLKCTIAWLRCLVALRRCVRLSAKAGFNPDQPRDDHGRWTDTGAADASFEALLDGFDGHIVPENVAYPGDFHDTVRDYFVKGLRAGGNKVETEVSLVLPGVPPMKARLDILARDPKGQLYGIDIKTAKILRSRLISRWSIHTLSAEPGSYLSTPKSATWGFRPARHYLPFRSVLFMHEVQELRWRSYHCRPNQNNLMSPHRPNFVGGGDA